MSAVHKLRYTPEEYLALEREAEHKSEYFDGEIFAMAGGNPTHSAIAFNVIAAIKPSLRAHRCRGFTSDMRVKVSATGLYTYPDVAVVCGEPQLEGDQRDVLTNPTLLVEVLSPSTEARDRGWKSSQYRQLDSLRDYVLVAQDHPHIEVYTREPGDQWTLTEVHGLTGTVHLPSLDCDLALADVYDQVEFPETLDA